MGGAARNTFTLFLISLFSTVFADLYSEYECNEPLISTAKLTATSSMVNRGPQNAILNEGNAWSAATNDFDQRLIIDFGRAMNVTRIWTQGRPNTEEYVMEYTISYGTNGLDYADYKDPSGGIMMFRGNTDSDSIRRNTFEVPIIAQWIRVNPTRWHDRISIRLEVYGCEYVENNMYFNGTALLKIDLLRDPINAFRETFRFRFKTSHANGVLLYSRGSQGDYIALQLYENRMILKVDLGARQVTHFSVGSLLDDNIWHDVLISRNRRNVYFSVDRAVVHGTVHGDYEKLNLNKAMYIGGVPHLQEGLDVIQNFTGCIDNLYFNGSNVFGDVKEAFEYGEALRYDRVNVLYNCPETQTASVTFLTQDAHAKLNGYEGMKTLNASFSFRTWESVGLLLFHPFSSAGHVALYLEDGRIKVELMAGGDAAKLVTDNYADTAFNDGRWHSVVLTVGHNLMVLSVDGRPMATRRQLAILTGRQYLVGGGVSIVLGESSRQMAGFVGCMRHIGIDGNYRLPTSWTEGADYCCAQTLAFDACRMVDRCNPNPCQHGGICRQNAMEFMCDCQTTGYSGAVCHTAIYPLSCQAYKNVRHGAVNQRVEVRIDIDGSGPLTPFPVTCEFYADGRVATVLHHGNEATTRVDGFQEAGEYQQEIHYDADMYQISTLINRSSTCHQHIRFSCRNARLFNSPSTEHDFRPYTWWVSRHNQQMDYWGGAAVGSRKCECGIYGTCMDPTKWCNCDAATPGGSIAIGGGGSSSVGGGGNVVLGPTTDLWLSDSGELTEKEHLPVRQLRVGDTGNALDDKEAHYTLGAFVCEGDDLFDNVITLRLADATINVPTFDMGHSGDIYFEFKTATENAVLLHSKGPTDYIKLSLVGGNQLQFQYQTGLGPMAVTRESPYRLSDNNWHSVTIERNRKEAMLIIDGTLKAEVREPPGPVRALYLTSELVVGATLEYRDGFVGCLRALLLNGQYVDLKQLARRAPYGISEGCVGKCDSWPCLNNGTCHERYDSYWCDCRWTAFKGPICADEIGVNLRQSSMIRYDFQGSSRSTIQEHIRIGFTTTNPKGFLLGLFSNVSGEYMTIMVSNSGHLRVVFDFGFERQEVIYTKKFFSLGQYHDVVLSRKNNGATLVLQIDNYEPYETHFNIKDSADAQFNNVQYLYIGRNESMTDGFIGCVSRVEFDDIYPLKLLFQQSGPGNVRSLGSPVNEDYCGVEPVTHPPDTIEIRPPPNVDENQLRKYNQTDSAVLGSILAVLFLAIVVLGILMGRYLHRHKGEYLTQEEVGAEHAMDANEAVCQGTTGHHVDKKKEWFI